MPPKKRVQLTRIGPAQNEDSSQQSAGLEPSVGNKSPEAGPQVRSIRLDIPLGESNKERYPYVDYMAEVKKEVARIKEQLKGQKEVQVLNVYDSSTEEEVEDVNSPTRKRAKVGTNRGKKNKRTRLREGDFHHVASGYDESDDFIDNSVHLYEVDEVPPDVSPPCGGFYINKRKIKSEEENAVEETKKKPSKIAEQTKSKKEKSVKEKKKKTSKTAEQIKSKKDKKSVKEMTKKKMTKSAERIKSKKEKNSVKEKKRKTAEQTKSEKEENSDKKTKKKASKAAKQKKSKEGDSSKKTKKKTSKTTEQINPENEENSAKKIKNKTTKTTKQVKSEKEKKSVKDTKKKTPKTAKPMEK